MPFHYQDIGDRLRAFRMGSGLSAEEIARRLGISRTALYRFEKGELVKIETLERLSELLGVSVPTLLGVGIEYIASAVSYFERMRQIEATAERIVVLAGPVSFLLASDAFLATLGDVLRESIPPEIEEAGRALEDVEAIVGILHARKVAYRARRPSVVNLISAQEIDRFLRNGMVGRHGLPAEVARARAAVARTEVEHLAAMIEEDPIGVQIGIVPDTLPHTGFHIFRQPERQLLVLSPFRLGEEPNIRVGVAMITSAPEALSLHEKSVNDMWRRAMKGQVAARHLRDLLARADAGEAKPAKRLHSV